MENMTDKQFKTILEMATMIVESSEDKEVAVKKLQNLEIMKQDTKQKKNPTD